MFNVFPYKTGGSMSYQCPENETRKLTNDNNLSNPPKLYNQRRLHKTTSWLHTKFLKKKNTYAEEAQSGRAGSALRDHLVQVFIFQIKKRNF